MQRTELSELDVFKKNMEFGRRCMVEVGNVDEANKSFLNAAVILERSKLVKDEIDNNTKQFLEAIRLNSDMLSPKTLSFQTEKEKKEDKGASAEFNRDIPIYIKFLNAISQIVTVSQDAKDFINLVAPKAFKIFQADAYQQGLKYLYGLGEPVDTKKAISIYKDLASQLKKPEQSVELAYVNLRLIAGYCHLADVSAALDVCRHISCVSMGKASRREFFSQLYHLSNIAIDKAQKKQIIELIVKFYDEKIKYDARCDNDLLENIRAFLNEYCDKAIKQGDAEAMLYKAVVSEDIGSLYHDALEYYVKAYLNAVATKNTQLIIKIVEKVINLQFKLELDSADNRMLNRDILMSAFELLNDPGFVSQNFSGALLELANKIINSPEICKKLAPQKADDIDVIDRMITVLTKQPIAKYNESFLKNTVKYYRGRQLSKKIENINNLLALLSDHKRNVEYIKTIEKFSEKSKKEKEYLEQLSREKNFAMAYRVLFLTYKPHIHAEVLKLIAGHVRRPMYLGASYLLLINDKENTRLMYGKEENERCQGPWLQLITLWSNLGMTKPGTKEHEYHQMARWYQAILRHAKTHKCCINDANAYLLCALNNNFNDATKQIRLDVEAGMMQALGLNAKDFEAFKKAKENSEEYKKYSRYFPTSVMARSEAYTLFGQKSEAKTTAQLELKEINLPSVYDAFRASVDNDMKPTPITRGRRSIYLATKIVLLTLDQAEAAKRFALPAQEIKKISNQAAKFLSDWARCTVGMVHTNTDRRTKYHNVASYFLNKLIKHARDRKIPMDDVDAFILCAQEYIPVASESIVNKVIKKNVESAMRDASGFKGKKPEFSKFKDSKKEAIKQYDKYFPIERSFALAECSDWGRSIDREVTHEEVKRTSMIVRFGGCINGDQ